jgi:hypothetical protein
MTGLPVLPLLGLGVLFLVTPVLVLGLVLALLGLRTRVRRLERQVAELEGRRAHAAAAAAPSPVPPRAPGSAPWAPQAEQAPEPAAGLAGPGEETPPRVPLAARAAVAAIEPEPAVGAPASPPGPPSRSGMTSWEGRVGGAWLSRLGAVLLLLGGGFFLKHAFDNAWIGPGGRVAVGLVSGAGLLAGGLRLAGEPAYRLSAQSLAAVGLGLLYLSLYAAHAVYGLVGPVAAFGGMAAVTAGAFGLALRLDARTMAALATLGGLLTPVLVGKESDPAATLFMYLAILDGGVLVAAFRRGWTGLALLAFAGTWLLYGGWLERWFEPDRLPMALGWATVYFLAFAAASLRGPRTPPPSESIQLARGLLILATPALYFAAARRVLDDPSGSRLATLALVLGALYLGAARVVRWSRRGGARVAVLHGAVGVAFLVVAPAAWLGRNDLAIAWSVEGLALLWGGVRLGSSRVRLWAIVVDALALGRWFTALSEDAGRAGTFLLAHPALPATITVAVTAALGALVYRARERGGTPLGRGESLAQPALWLVSVLSPAVLLSAEFSQFRTLVIPPPYVPVVKAVVWMLAVMALLALARGDQTRVLLIAASALLVVVVGDALQEADRWERVQVTLRPAVWNPRFLAGCLLVVLTWLHGQVAGGLPYLGDRARSRLATLGAAGAAVLLLWNLSAEVLLMPLPPTGFDPGKLRSAGLSVLWAVYAVLAMAWGLRRDRSWLRIGAIGLFGVTVLKVLAVDLADLDALYRILSVLVLGGALLLGSFLYARRRRRAPAGGAP